MLEIIILFVVGVVTWFLWQRYRKMTLRTRIGVPGPKVNMFSGNLKDIIKASEKYPGQPFDIFWDWRKEYGNVFGYYLGPRLSVVLADMDLAKEIFIKQFDCFVNRKNFAGDTSVLADSLVRLQGDKWKHVRNSISPTFTSKKMRQMASTINCKIDVLLDRCEKNSNNNNAVDIQNFFQALTLDVIGQCAFAMNVNCQTDPDDLFLLNCKKFFSETDYRKSKLLQFLIGLLELGPIFFPLLKSTMKYSEAETWLVNGLKSVIDQRRKNYKKNESVDFLQLLLEQQQEEQENVKKGIADKSQILSDNAIIGNAYVFLLAGYETTSTALGFTAWLLAKHRDVQEKLQKEIDEKIGEGVDYELVHKLPYLDAVFHESLRVYPPVVQFLVRTCVKECQVGPVHFVPGVQASVPTKLIHLDPDIWPEPLKFDPDRFLNNTYQPLSWIPFGSGPRNCVGMRFADMVYKMVMVRLLKKYNLLMGADFEDPLSVIDAGVFQRPKNGIKVYLEKRNA